MLGSRYPNPKRALAPALVAAAVVVAACWPPRAGFGQGPAGGAPIDLLKGTPFDRLTLTDGKVYLIDPVSPRPLPPVETKEKDKGKGKKKAKVNESVGIPGEEIKEQTKVVEEEEDPANMLVIHLIDGEVRDFKLNRSSIRKLEYFEDMLLAKGDQLRQAGEYAQAFEYFMAAHQRDPKWAGLPRRLDDLLFAEGSSALTEGDGVRGLRLLRELLGRNPNYEGLAEKVAGAYASQVGRALGAGLFAKGRQLLHEMEGAAPNDSQTKSARDSFVSKARELVASAPKDDGPERLDALTKALRIWPKLEGADEQFAAAFNALPTLEVGVADVPRAAEGPATKGSAPPAWGVLGPWSRSPVSERAAGLLYLPVLANDSEDALRGKLPGQLAKSLDANKLGQQLTIRLKTDKAWSDGSRPASAIDVVRALSDRADPRSPAYNARWANLLEHLDAPEPIRVELKFTRVPLAPASWLRVPVGPANAAWDGWVTAPDGRRLPVGDGPFRWDGGDADRARFFAPEGGPSKVRRVQEVRYGHAAAALAALVRGDVSLVEQVPADRAAALAKLPDVKVGRYGRPSVHRIALDGRNPFLRNRSLRRGLSYAIDRKALLEETVLKRAADDANAVADGVFPKGSYADAKEVKPLPFDPVLAKMLIVAAARELELKTIKLTFEYPATPEAQAVVPRLAEAFRQAGVEIKLVEVPAAELEEGLRSGRRFHLAYRADRVTDPGSEAGNLICPGYDAPPLAEGLAAITSPRIMQLLLQLEAVSDPATARSVLNLIDREVRDELPVLPLWQIEDHYAWRARLDGPVDGAEHLYQGIETWSIAPWFAKDPW